MAKQSKLVIVEPDKGTAGDLLSFLSPEKVYRALESANVTPERIIGAIASIAFDGDTAAKDRQAALKMLLALPGEALAAAGELQSVTARAERTLPGGTASVEVRGVSTVTQQEATMALLAQGDTEDIDLEARLSGAEPGLVPQGGQNGDVQRPTGGGATSGGPGDGERGDRDVLPVGATGGTEGGPGIPGDPPAEGPGSVQGGVQQAEGVGGSPRSINGGGIGDAEQADGTSTTVTGSTGGAGNTTSTGSTTDNGPDTAAGGSIRPGRSIEPSDGATGTGGPTDGAGEPAPGRAARGRPNRNPETGKFTGPQPITHGRGSYSFVPPPGPRAPAGDPLGLLAGAGRVPGGNPSLGWTSTPDDGVPDIGDGTGSPTGDEPVPGGPTGGSSVKRPGTEP